MFFGFWHLSFLFFLSPLSLSVVLGGLSRCCRLALALSQFFFHGSSLSLFCSFIQWYQQVVELCSCFFDHVYETSLRTIFSVIFRGGSLRGGLVLQCRFCSYRRSVAIVIYLLLRGIVSASRFE